MKPILHTLSRGPSPHGLSKLIDWLTDCPRRVELDLKHDSPETRASFVQRYSAALVGIIGHAYNEHWWKLIQGGKAVASLPPVAFEEAGLVDRDARLEAERCCEALYKVIGPEGKVPLHSAEIVAIEEELWIKAANVLHCLNGLPVFTCRVDLVLKLAAPHIKALRAHVCADESCNVDGAVDLLKPGYWLLDYKFYGRREANQLDRATYSTQFATYQEVWNHVHPKEKVLGTIQVTCFNVKEHPIRFTVVPPPGKAVLSSVRCLLDRAYAIQQTEPKPVIPIDSYCFPYGSVCPYLVNGECERS